MRGWLTDCFTDSESLEINIRPRLSHSNSFGNDAEKDTAGCRAFNRKYIVIGGISVIKKKEETENNAPQWTLW